MKYVLELKAESVTGMYVVTQLGLDYTSQLGLECSLFLSFSGLLLVRGLWTMFCRLLILLKPKPQMGLGLSVINKLFRSAFTRHNLKLVYTKA